MRLDFIACKYTYFIQYIFYSKVIFFSKGQNIYLKKTTFQL